MLSEEQKRMVREAAVHAIVHHAPLYITDLAESMRGLFDGFAKALPRCHDQHEYVQRRRDLDIAIYREMVAAERITCAMLGIELEIPF